MGVALEAELREALMGDRTPKFLATLDEKGCPNCVPVISLMPHEGARLIFGEFFMHKTRRNLLADPHVAIAVLTEDFRGWMLQGEFEGFETTGERVDLINQTPMFRYNAYTSIRAAGSIRLTAISDKHVLPRGRLYADFSLVSAAARVLALIAADGRERCMPLPVTEKFQRATAIRAVALRGAGPYPVAFPLITCVAAGPNRLLLRDPLADAHLGGVAPGTEVAAAILTQEPIAYQVKGRYQEWKAGVHHIALTACYSASPPLLGERLDDKI